MIVLNGGSYYPNSKDIDEQWIPKVGSDDLIGFIPAATIRSESEYLDFFKEQMRYYGLHNIKLINLYSNWEATAREAKVIFIAGGNTYKLMKAIKESGFSKFLEEKHVDRVIVGNSAGAVIFGQSLTSSNSRDIIGMNDTRGLGLLNYSICPHYTKEKSGKLKELAVKLRQKVIGLPETSAIIIDDNNIETLVNSICVFGEAD